MKGSFTCDRCGNAIDHGDERECIVTSTEEDGTLSEFSYTVDEKCLVQIIKESDANGSTVLVL
jgi:hypothetical protein